jgi:hypothetical protein
VNHAGLQKAILEICDSRGLHVHHCAMNRSQAGFPDLVIVGRWVLWRELKIPPDTVTSEQRLLGYKLQAAGEDWGIWTPAEFDSGLIRTELEAIS